MRTSLWFWITSSKDIWLPGIWLCLHVGCKHYLLIYKKIKCTQPWSNAFFIRILKSQLPVSSSLKRRKGKWEQQLQLQKGVCVCENQKLMWQEKPIMALSFAGIIVMPHYSPKPLIITWKLTGFFSNYHTVSTHLSFTCINGLESPSGEDIRSIRKLFFSDMGHTMQYKHYT